MSNLVYIPISKLHEHPHNPRKSIGDVSELAESIKAKGVLQNLTVVPAENDEYTILIGHRRYNAAKLAGLTELPCTIAEMSEEDQIATMLVENMQRSDLTLYEEAKGFQMMLDLGKSVEEVADMSGFSATTVRSRVKLTEFDEAKFSKAVNRGATLFDFAKIAEIEDSEEKENLLDKAGTAEFNNALSTARSRQKSAKLMAKWREQISQWATEVIRNSYSEPIKTSDGTEVSTQYVRNYCHYTHKQETIDPPEDINTVKYYFMCSPNQIDIYRELDDNVIAERAEKERIEAERKAKREAKMAQFAEISDRHRQLRRDFIMNFGAFNRKDTEIWEFITEAMVTAQAYAHGYYVATDSELTELGELLGVSYNSELKELNYQEFLIAKRDNPERTALLTALWIMDRGSYYTEKWNSEAMAYLYVPCENNKLDKLYRLLSYLGYNQSQEEVAMRNGTYALFDKVEE